VLNWQDNNGMLTHSLNCISAGLCSRRKVYYI